MLNCPYSRAPLQSKCSDWFLIVLSLHGHCPHKSVPILRSHCTVYGRADAAERSACSAQESLVDTRNTLTSLQTHHTALKQHLERAEQHSQDSATQAREFAAQVKELSADKDALVSELVTAKNAAFSVKQDCKQLGKCLKGSDPLQAIICMLDESEADSGKKAHNSELMPVIKRLADFLKHNSGMYSC